MTEKSKKVLKRGNIYLSGGMQYAADLGAAWRVDCSNKLMEMGYLPLDITALDVAYAQAHGELLLPSRDKHLEFKSDIRKHFVYTDLTLIEKNSDALIVLYDESARRGAGTISECQFAYLHNIPIFIVSVFDDIHNETPGWLQALGTKLFSNFDELYEYLNQLPYGILKKDMYGNHRSDASYLCSLCGDTFIKKKHLFVSKVSPLLCSKCVNIVDNTHANKVDRYNFFINYLEEEFDLYNSSKKDS